MAADLRAGIHANLRNRLFLNPLTTLAVICLNGSLGSRMASLYTRHIYRRAIGDAFPGHKDWQRNGVALMNAKVSLNVAAGKWRTPRADERDASRNQLTATIEGFNARSSERVPKFILNATCLNTGSEFQFCFSEMGDPRLGFIRFDEADLVRAYRVLLERLGLLYRPRDPKRRIDKRLLRGAEPEHAAPVENPMVPRELAAAHLNWWRLASRLDATSTKLGASEAFELEAPAYLPPAVRALTTKEGTLKVYNATAGALRRAKVAAWFLLKARQDQAPEGFDREVQVANFWKALDDIDPLIGRHLREILPGEPSAGGIPFDAQVLTFFYEIYFFRTASVFDTDEARLQQFTLSDAVAASANFPPVFPPFELKGAYDRSVAPRVALTDGGVYDNQGITALLDEGCSHIIASDAGGIPQYQPVPASGRLGMMLRIVDVLMANLRDWQLRHLRDERVMTNLAACLSAQPLHDRYNVRSVAFFHMLSDPNDAVPAGAAAVSPHECSGEIARIRTDLDRFNEVEQDALIYQGYQLADRFVRKHLSDFGLENAPAPDPERALGVEAYNPGVDHHLVLAAGARRFFRLTAHFPLLAWLGSGAVLAAALVLLYLYSLEDIVSGAARVVWSFLKFPFFREGAPLESAIGEPGGFIQLLADPYVVLAVFIGLLAIYIVSAGRDAAEIFFGSLAVGRKWDAGDTSDLVRLGVRNVLWFFGLLPLWIALMLSLISLVILLLFGTCWHWIGRRTTRLLARPIETATP